MHALRHITPNVGSEVLDVRVDELTESQREALRAQLIDRKVLVVRDQDVDSFGYKSFVETFGEVVPDDLVRSPTTLQSWVLFTSSRVSARRSISGTWTIRFARCQRPY